MNLQPAVPTGTTRRDVSGTATWHGTFRDGHGELSTTSDTLDRVAYTYASRFEDAPGACPEELLAAAHAGCFNHALANIAGLNGVVFDHLDTRVTVTMGRDDTGPAIVAVHIDVAATQSAQPSPPAPPGDDRAAPEIQELAERALVACALSKALTVTPTMTARVPPATARE